MSRGSKKKDMEQHCYLKQGLSLAEDEMYT